MTKDYDPYDALADEVAGDHVEPLAVRAAKQERARIRREQAMWISELRRMGFNPEADGLEEATRDAEPYDGDRGSGSWRGEERDA